MAAKVIKYKIVDARPAEIGEAVEYWINQGWEVYGNPLTWESGQTAYIGQAIVKREKPGQGR
jgi:hypothetical protein